MTPGTALNRLSNPEIKHTMRLLFVHDRLGAYGGAEVNVMLTATEFRRRGHTVGLLHGPATGKDELSWRRLFPLRFSLESHEASAVTAEAIATTAPDVIFIHNLSDLEVISALTDSGAPVVRMVHDHNLYCMRGYKYHYFSRKICTRPASLYCVFSCGASIARNPRPGLPVQWVSYAEKRSEIDLNRGFDRMIVATAYMRDELLRNGFAPDRIEVLAPVPGPATAVARSSFDARNRIVYAGQIVRGKGVDILLESLALVKAPFECVILGDGNHRAYCERLSRKLGLEDRVHFAGYVSREQVGEAYRDASVAVVSSVWPEPFGAVGLEAMRHGLPVVAFDAGGIGEWLADGVTGYLAPWMDRVSFAASVDKLLGDKTLARELGEQGRQRAELHFCFEDYIAGLEDLLARVSSARAETALR